MAVAIRKWRQSNVVIISSNKPAIYVVPYFEKPLYPISFFNTVLHLRGLRIMRSRPDLVRVIPNVLEVADPF